MNKNLITLAAIVILMSVSFATLGSTVLTADRSSAITVDNDDQGALALTPNTSNGVVNNGTGGELEIDLPGSTTNSNGLNVNSTLELGDATFTGTEDVNTGAYTVTNNFNKQANVTVGYNIADTSSIGGQLKVVVKNNSATPSVKSFTVNSGNPSDEVSFDVSDGGTLDVAIQVQTANDNAADFSGTLEHRAEVIN